MIKHFGLPVGDREVKATIQTYDQASGEILWLMGRGAARLDSLEDRERQAKLFKRDMLTFDYSGQGETGGDFGETTISQHVQEAKAAYGWLHQIYSGPLTVTGASYGGFIAALIAAESPSDNLILRAPALFTPDKLDIPWSELEAEVPGITRDYRHDLELMVKNPLFEKLARFTGRILIIEHGADDVIPPTVLQAYREALPQADYWLAPDVLHSVTASSQEARHRYEKHIADWLNG